MPITSSPIKWILSLLLFAAISGFTVVLTRTLLKTPLSEAVGHVLANVWATTALVDYAAGLSFSVPYVIALGPTPVASLLWTLAFLVLGNPVFALRLILLLLVESNAFPGSNVSDSEPGGVTAIPRESSNRSFEALLNDSSQTATEISSLSEALLPAKRLTPSTDIQKSRFPAVKASIWVYTGLSFIGYVTIVIYALVKEPVSRGWEYISTDDWSLTTFLDLLLGVYSTMHILYVREGGFNSLRMWVILLCLLFLGNGVTCLYVMNLLWRARRSDGSNALSLREMLFSL